MTVNVPGRGEVHIDVPLTNIAVAFMQRREAFVADKAFPVLPVNKQSNKYFTFPKGAWFRDQMEKRAPGAESAGATYDISSDSYLCDVWALHKDLADQIRENYDSPLQPEREMTEFLTQQGLIRRERAWASEMFTTSVWTGDQTGVDSASPGANQFGRWDRADSTPIEDIRKGVRTVHGRTGFRPNKLVLGREVYDALVDHPDIVGRLDRGQTTGPAIVLRQNLAALFELEEILVMDAVYNSAVEGATDSMAFIGGKSALLLYAPASPGLYTPSAGYTFAWTGAGALGLQMSRYRMDTRKADRLEIEMAFDHKLVAADLGLFYATAVN